VWAVGVNNDGTFVIGDDTVGSIRLNIALSGNLLLGTITDAFTSGYRAIYINGTSGSGFITRVGDRSYSIKANLGDTYLGAYAGYLSTGSGNVFIGRQAGFNEVGSNKLYIANSDTAIPLIGGDFSTQILKVGGVQQFAVQYAPAGTGVANGSIFYGTDGDLYFKNGSGTVTKIN
jgi:hypothetical protein